MTNLTKTICLNLTTYKYNMDINFNKSIKINDPVY